MILVVRRHDTKAIALIKKLTVSESMTFVWCQGWPGKHTIDGDCSFICLSKKQMPVVEYFAKNPCDTIRQAAKELKRTYIEIFRIVKEVDIQVKAERKERCVKDAMKSNYSAFMF